MKSTVVRDPLRGFWREIYYFTITTQFSYRHSYHAWILDAPLTLANYVFRDVLIVAKNNIPEENRHYSHLGASTNPHTNQKICGVNDVQYLFCALARAPISVFPGIHYYTIYITCIYKLIAKGNSKIFPYMHYN